MNSATQLTLTRALIDIESTTGREGPAGSWLATTLRNLGYRVLEQPVTDGRFNVYASLGPPAVVFSTHMDCVPPFLPSREDGGRLYGRGACDAKGTAIAQIAAAERLRALGETRAALLFVVGEERGSDGAKRANTIAPGSKFLINGEPTDGRMGLATRGVYRSRLRARGRAAHSSQPELGASAIDKLVDALVALRGVEWPADPDLGRTHYNIGIIRGGVAPNVIPAEAEAELMFRIVGDHAPVRARLEQAVAPMATAEELLIVPPVRLTTVPGVPTAVFNFATDIPFLDRWGEPVLLGPGSVAMAHTADESIGIRELIDAVDLYVDVARQLLARC